MTVRLKPDLNTKFHIDFSWWEKQNRDIRIYLRESLCPDCKAAYLAMPDDREVDWVDPETAEVTRVDSLWQRLRTCCSRKPGYITDSTPVIESIFLTLLANGNKPLSVLELHKRIDKRPPEVLLRMLTRGQVYLGIRPV